MAWYQRLFGLDRVPFDFRHYDREETGYGVVLMDPLLGIAIGLHTNTANRGEAFEMPASRAAGPGVQRPRRRPALIAGGQLPGRRRGPGARAAPTGPAR